ncbi:MAG: hypothetical protein ACJ8FY_12755 [Gemmataceae bacterium]
MSIRGLCPNCSSILSVPETAAGKRVRCPKCQAKILLQQAESSSSWEPADQANVDPLVPSARTRREHEERRGIKLREKRKKAPGLPFPVVLAACFLSFVLFAVGGFFAVRALVGSRENPPREAGEGTGDPAPEGSNKFFGSLGNATPTGTKYIPRVSEKKLEEFLETHDPFTITDDQVFAIMGAPTRRDPPVTARKNGQIFTVYKAFWEVPGSGITSQIGFSNGHIAGMILGLETTPHGSRGGK